MYARRGRRCKPRVKRRVVNARSESSLALFNLCHKLPFTCMRPVDKRKKAPTSSRSKLQVWLDKIQQDSWQLELVISGVVIFLLLGATPAMSQLEYKIDLLKLSGHYLDFASNIGFSYLQGGHLIITLSFIVHLIFRGFWIGAIGLRSVSGDFDYQALGFQPRFDAWLRTRLGSFDSFIERLEIQASITFSLGFLLFFAFISSGLFLLATMGIGSFVGLLINDKLGFTSRVNTYFIIVLVLLIFGFVFLGLVYLFDFATLGAVKKRRWAQRLYFPIYRFLGWITLARFYRPFYYNLIDHPFGRKLVRLVIPGIFIATLLIDLEVGRNQFFPTSTAGANALSAGVYLDRDEFSKPYFELPSLQSRIAVADYLEIFIPYLGRDHDPAIRDKFPDLPTSTLRSVGIDGLLSVEDESISIDTLLPAHVGIHRLYLNDSLLQNVPWKFYHHPLRDQPGLLYELPVYDLPRGEHCLTFEVYQKISRRAGFDWEEWRTICFLR